MDKEKIFEEFFRSLRITLTNAFSYSKDHPYFIKSVENFKLKLEEAQGLLSPFKIGVTDSGFMIDGENLTRTGFYDELARLLHQRKIKSIEVKTGVTQGQIVGFFSVISLSPKDIFKRGGVTALLEKQQAVNFIVEELDYSAFLQAQGQECSDVWGYMLKQAVEENDQIKLNNLADNFSGLIKRTNQNDIFESEEVPANLNDFLVSLRENNKEQFAKCSKDLFLWLLRNKKSLNEEKLAKLKLIFNSLDQEDLGNLFWEGLAQEDNFDALSLELFARIAEQKNPPQVAQGFLNKVNASRQLSSDPKIARRIKDLLTGVQTNQLSAVYRNTLEFLVKRISSSGVLFFDQKALRENYRYIVLNILSIEQSPENLLAAAQVLEKELISAFEDNDRVFLKDFWGILVKRKKEGNSACIGLEKKLSAFIENIILNQTLAAADEFFLGLVSSPSREVNFYLDKIFAAEKADKNILSLFLKFFPANLDIFYVKVQARLQDIEFLSTLIEALGQLANPVTLGILDHIYSSANELIKIEILNIMRKLKKVDVQFLTRQLNTHSPLLRKNLLAVLILDAQSTDGVLGLLFKIPGFCGRNNQLLIENMQIVFDLRLIEAAGYIRDLSRRRFFWNRKLRDKAKQILKEWNAF
jgi:hypothetical protein